MGSGVVGHRGAGVPNHVTRALGPGQGDVIRQSRQMVAFLARDLQLIQRGAC